MRVCVPGLLAALLLATVGRAWAADTTYVRFTTNLGNIDVQLLSDEAPLNVANFLQYVDNHLYDNTIFHRSVPGYILQGGVYLDQVDSQSFLIPIATFAPVQNEAGVSNTAGTLAMAQLGTDPNSATSSWFFNDINNDGSSPLFPNLNTLNGGFTVFGRIADSSSMATMEYIAGLPIAPNTEYPVINFTGSLTLANLVVISSIARVNLTRFTSWQTTAFTPTQQGTAGFTDSSATPWKDGVPNLLKYLYGIDPSRGMTAADRAALPALGTVVSGSTQFLTLSYRQSSTETGLSVVLQTSPDLVTWTNSTNPPFQSGTDAATGNPIMEFAVPFSTSVRFLRLQVTGS